MRLPSKISVVMMVNVNDLSPGAMVKDVYSLTESAIKRVYSNESNAQEPETDTESESDNTAMNFSDYEGEYYAPNYDWDSYIGVNEDGLFAMAIFSPDPVGDMQTWQHEEGDIFSRKRKNGSAAESIIFERDAAGKVVAVVQHGYRALKR